MRFHCFRCGNKLTKKRYNLYECPKCSYDHFINPYPTTSVIIINQKEELMLVKRKYPPRKGYWDLPGGFIDIKETGEEGVKREIKEELGIQLDKVFYIGSYPDKYFFQGFNMDTITLSFYSKISNQEIKVSDDITGFSFFNKNKIPYNKLAFKNLSISIKEYLKIKRLLK